jgi:hypothetical protein
MRRIYEVYHLSELRCHDISTKLQEDQYRHLNNITIITVTIWEAVNLVLLVEVIYEVCRWDGFMWHDMSTKFPDDWFRGSSNVKDLSQQFERL